MTRELPKILVVDDDVELLKALHRALSRRSFEMAIFDCPKAFVAGVTAETDADVIVLDVGMKGLDGLEVQAALKKAGCHIPVVFMSGEVDLKGMNTAWKEGAFDFLLKPFTTEELLRAIKRALVEAPVNRDARQVLRTLTPREREVYTAIVSGASNVETAERLGITERTVKLHRKNLRTKLGVDTIADLVRYYETHRSFLQ